SRIVCVVRRRLCPSRAPAPPELHTLSLHDALPISRDTPTWSSGQISYRGTPQWSSGWTNSRGALKWSSGRTNSRGARQVVRWPEDRKSTRLNSSHVKISYAVFCLKKKKNTSQTTKG